MEQNGSQKFFYSLEELINDAFGQDVSIIRMDRVPGGDINNAYRLSLSNGESLFVKTNSASNLDSFLTESGGLCALRSLKKIGVPEVLGAGTDEQRGISFLALEYIESSPQTPNFTGQTVWLMWIPKEAEQDSVFMRIIISELRPRRITRKRHGLNFTANAGFCLRLPWQRNTLILL